MTTTQATSFSGFDGVLACIGGGNMASAILGGLLREGFAAQRLLVVEPQQAAREHLRATLGLHALPAAGDALRAADVALWAVKPQHMQQAVQQAVPFLPGALHISIAAGLGTATLCRWMGSERVVRVMPNTPALIGQGISALYAAAGASQADCRCADALLAPTGQRLWLHDEAQMDAVTALSGSGPAYVFYFIEALMQGGVALGLSAQQSRLLAEQTFAGAALLSQSSAQDPAALRERVTSKGGTTHAALAVMQQHHMAEHFIEALHACHQRAQELGRDMG